MVAKVEVKKLFTQYANHYNEALTSRIDVKQVARLYSTAFIEAGPAGVTVGKNGGELEAMLTNGFAAYRKLGTKSMTMTDVGVTPIDTDHCVARVQWRGAYETGESKSVSIDFEVSYLVEKRNGELKVFGWIVGDEQAAFKDHGLM